MEKQRCILFTLLAVCSLPLQAATSLDGTNYFAYGANIGWINARGDNIHGAVIGEFVCSGYLYGANIGWINLGDGTPANGWSYSNGAGDWGVNVSSNGDLSGYAYGANIGWINFETNGDARVDLLTGNMEGYAYGANVGWISLSNSQAFVQTDYLDEGPDSDLDGLPDMWEFSKTNDLTIMNASTDSDSDGYADHDERTAGTDPFNDADLLEISVIAPSPTVTNLNITWSSQPTRLYSLEKITSITNSAWTDSGLGIFAPDGSSTTRAIADNATTSRYYRVQAIRPLAP